MKKYQKPITRIIRLKNVLLLGPVHSTIGDGEFAKRHDFIIEDDEE